MSNILAFQPRPRFPAEADTRGRPEGKVVIFPGVRYERQDPGVSGAESADPGRRVPSPPKPTSKGTG